LCGCCDECEDNEWLESECQCVQCETCLVCEQTCLEQKCEKCLCHVVDDVCVNCGAIGRPDEGGQLLLKDSKKPMAPKRAFRSWSKSEKSIMRSLFISGMSLAEIANHLDRTENAVVVQLANLRLVSDVDLSNAVHQAQLRYNRVINRDPEAPF
jgi:DNA-binding CsgD family transcriptional regulator